MSRNSSRTIVITGATRGLGRAMAERLIEKGHRVVGCGRNAASAQDLARKYGVPHRFDAVDVSSDLDVGRWAKEVLESHGPPDLLLNNAAIVNRNAPLWELGADEVSELYDVNLKGVVNMIRHFVPAMIERSSGVIVNFSSGWGRSTSPEVATYCSSKWGIEGLTKALAQELPRGMAAIPLNPGIINTEMLQSCFGHSADKFPDADTWSHAAVPFLLKLGAKHNGESLSVE
ncbi:MAG: SDR family NAD(P)-dependent oxidoreductase [Planctomycetota bacterium]|nr:SDR family NAD(P)-dependent oxidoreductase [Planctomycetota bacterium]MDA1211028.1 SDR family NAD(P)-dependent oxidoreductase [Planctomycetota bacterium]